MSGGRRPDPPQEPVDLPGSLTHGSFQAYQVWKCRCQECQDYVRKYAQRARVVRTVLGVPRGVRHGSKYTYSYYRCRCDACCEARRSYDRERYELRQRGQGQ